MRVIQGVLAVLLFSRLGEVKDQARLHGQDLVGPQRLESSQTTQENSLAVSDAVRAEEEEEEDEEEEEASPTRNKYCRRNQCRWHWCFESLCVKKPCFKRRCCKKVIYKCNDPEANEGTELEGI